MQRSLLSGSLIAVGAVALGSAGCSSDDSSSAPIQTSTPDTTSQGAATTTEPPISVATTLVAPTSTTSTSTTSSAVPSGDPLAYVEAITNDTYDELDAMLAEVAPDGPAAWYGLHQLAVRTALSDAGLDSLIGEQTVDQRGDAVTHCMSGDATIDDECLEFTDFIVDDGLLYTFSVDGVQIDDRLGVGGDPDSAAGVEASVVTSYRSIESDLLLVVVEVTAATPANLSLSGSTYVDPDGRQMSATQSVGPSDLQQGATALAIVGFAQADPGGTLVIEVSSDDFSNRGELTLNVPAAPS
ncbi:MAG: hypothetical protein AAGF73_16425 [Actinomycetota bacterium]